MVSHRHGRIDISRLRPDRFDIIRALDRAIFPNDSPVDVGRSEWWVAWDRGEPVAFAGAYTLMHERNIVMLSRCGVLPSHRGRGLQIRLIRARLRWARGCTTVITYTDPTNVVSSNNLIRSGFLLYQPQWAYVGQEFLYWRRDA